jgi:hypothetical protein
MEAEFAREGLQNSLTSSNQAFHWVSVRFAMIDAFYIGLGMF